MKRKHSYGKTIALAVFIFSLSIIFVSCMESPLSPVGPSTDVQLSAPIIDEIYTSGDFIKKTPLKVNSDGTMSDVTTQSTTPRQIDTLTIQPEYTEEKVELGKFGLMGFSAPVRSYKPISAGNLPSLPENDFTLPAEIINDTNQFDYISVYSGRLSLTITNNLPVPIDFPNGITLRNNWTSPVDNNLIANFVVNGSLRQGESITIPADLTGMFLRGILTTDPISIHTAGSSNPVTIDSSNTIAVSFQFQSLVANNAYAVIPSQQITPRDSLTSFTVDDSVVIQDARFQSGKFLVLVKSDIDLETESVVRIQELYSSTSQTSLALTQLLASKDSLSTSISVDTLYISEPSGTTIGTRLHYSIGIRVINSQGLKKHVDQYDVVSVKLLPQDSLVIRSITGRIPPQYRDINSGGILQFDLGNIKDKASAVLAFKNTKILAHLAFTGGTPFDYTNLQLIAVNSKYHQSVSMMVPSRRIDPTQGDSPLDLSRAANYENFINFFGLHFPDLPDSVYVRGQLVISPMDVFTSSTNYSIYDTSKVYPSFDFNISSVMSIKNGRISETQDLQGKIPKEFTRAVKNAMISFVFTNRIPFVLSSDIGFLGVNVSTGKRDTLISFNSLGPIASAHLGADSLTDSPVVSNVKIYLTGDQIDKVNQADSLAIRINIATGNNGAIVKIRNTDAIRVQASINARYTINKP